jgi:hypothetical protein
LLLLLLLELLLQLLNVVVLMLLCWAFLFAAAEFSAACRHDAAIAAVDDKVPAPSVNTVKAGLEAQEIAPKSRLQV